MLLDVSTLYSDVQVTLLVDNATERILQACKFEMSADGHNWVSSHFITSFRILRRVETTLVGKLDCVLVDLAAPGMGCTLLECSFITRHRGSEMGSRYFRTRLTGDREERWAVHEMWIRGSLI